MKNIEEIRDEINKIDEEMAHLFEKRMNLVDNVLIYKKQNNLPIFDSSRENDVLKNNLNKIENEEYKIYYSKFIKNVMKVSKDFQYEKINDDNICDLVLIKRNGLDNVDDIFDLNRKVLIVTDDNIPNEYYEKIINKSKDPYLFVLPNGENNKSFEKYKNILEFMVLKGFVRSDCVVACGGGVVGDIAAFAASTYMRGIDFYNVPTTLLSQVDSSLGGKTAVNFDNYKNVIGSFYNPKKVLIDVETLKTLNKRQLHAGLVEAIKMGATCDKELFELIEKSENILDDVEEIIIKSLKVKNKIVSLDPKENNIRRVLNFGHTVGHAIESHNKFGTYLHGEAVGLGMLYFSSDKVKERLINVLNKYDLPTTHYISKEKLFSKICFDKKRVNDQIYIVYVEEIGKYEIKKISLEEIKNYL